MAEAQRSRTIVLISLVTIAASLVVMAGWIFNIPGLQAVFPAFEPMKFNTALCFVLLGGALLTAQYSTHKYSLFFYILSSLVTLIALVTFFQNLFHFNAGLDQLFVKDGRILDKTYPFPGRISVTSDSCFLLMGAGFLMLTAKRPVFNIISQYLFHIVTILSSIAIIGYLYRATFFYGLSSVGPMAVQSVVLFFFISIGASLLHPSLGITNLFTGQLVGNKMARRLFILIIFVVVALGTLRIQTQRYYQFSIELWVALVTVCFLSICLLVIWNTAKWLNGIDKKRSKAEEEIKVMNADLEKVVAERTTEFHRSEEKYRLLIEHASDAIYTVDFKGNFTDANASMCKMIGYSKDELLEMNVEDVIDPEELKIDPVKHGPRNPGEYAMRERKLLRKDGTIFDAEVNVKMFQDDRVLVIARDVTGRKKMEAELKEAEIKFRTLADQSMVGVYIFQQGKFVYVNPRFAEIFGYEPHELVGTYPVEVIIHQDYRSTVRENVRKRMEEEVASIHYEVMGLKKDGTANWIEFYGNRVMIAGEPTIIGSMLDITERKQAEDLILKEKMLSDTIINSLPGVFYLFNEEGQYLRWNQNVEVVTGYAASEIEQKNAIDLIAPEDREKVQRIIEQVFMEGYATVEAHTINKNGTRTPFLFTGIPILYENQRCLLGTGIDISSRLKAEEELRMSEQKYKLLFESSPLPLWMIAKDDLTIIAVNDVATKIYGYTREELVNKSVAMLRPPEDRNRQLAGDTIEVTGGAADVGIVKHLKKDGTPMFVNIVANDIIFENRAVRLSFTNDVTKRLSAEESLKKSEANLQTILNTTDTAYALFDPELKALAFNQKAIEFTQTHYHHTPKKGDLITDYYSHDRLPEFLNLTSQVLQGKYVGYQVDYPLEDNQVAWFDVSLSPITDKNKKILGLLLTLNDITERKKAEEELRSAYTRIQSQINSIKGMAWKQSHLMRSPLANLKALADLLKEHPADTESLMHFQTELDRLDTIIHEMAQDASDHVA